MARTKQTARNSYYPGLTKNVQLDTAYYVHAHSGNEGEVEAGDNPAVDCVPPRAVTAPGADGCTHHDHDGIHGGLVDERVGHNTSLPLRKKRKASALSSPRPEPAVAPTAWMTGRMRKASMIPGLPKDLQNRLEDLELMAQKVQELHEELAYLFDKTQNRFQLDGRERGLVTVPSDEKAERMRKACTMLQGVEDNIDTQKGVLGEVKKMLRLVLEDHGDV